MQVIVHAAVNIIVFRFFNGTSAASAPRETLSGLFCTLPVCSSALAHKRLSTRKEAGAASHLWNVPQQLRSAEALLRQNILLAQTAPRQQAARR